MKKQGLSTLEVWMLWTCKNIFEFVLSFEHINFAINGKYIPKKLCQSKLLCFTCDLSNIQKCSFKECPLTWVTPLIVFIPKYNYIQNAVLKWVLKIQILSYKQTKKWDMSRAILGKGLLSWCP